MRSISFMRSAFLLASIVAVSSVFVSCTKATPASETYLYTARSSDWAAPVAGDETWEYFVYVPGITQYVLDNKAVLVYYQDLNQFSTETLMPFTNSNTGVDYTYVTGIDNISGGYLKVNVTATDAIHDPSYNSPVGFKVVIIPN